MHNCDIVYFVSTDEILCIVYAQLRCCVLCTQSCDIAYFVRTYAILRIVYTQLRYCIYCVPTDAILPSVYAQLRYCVTCMHNCNITYWIRIIAHSIHILSTGFVWRTHICSRNTILYRGLEVQWYNCPMKVSNDTTALQCTLSQPCGQCAAVHAKPAMRPMRCGAR